MRYFKKLVPRTKVTLANNQQIEFPNLDGVTGYYATENEYQQSQFLYFIQAQRYGITEISAEEFDTEYTQKKMKYGSSLKPTWRRETFGPQHVLAGRPLNPIASNPHAVHAAVAVTATDVPAEKHGDLYVPPAPKAEPKEPEIVPTLGKRIKQ